MFTGLVQKKAKVTARNEDRLCLHAPELSGALKLGDSIAVNGVCLTIAGEPSNGRLEFRASPETYSCTNLENLSPGDEVNLEAAATLGSSLDGHILQGHVDEVGEISKIEALGEYRRVLIRYDPKNSALIVEKGSIAINGISMTINEILDPDQFSVMVIPHTYENTSFKNSAPGTKVNLEFDILGKYVQRLIQQKASASP